MRSRPRKEWTSSRTWLSITTHSASKYHLNPPEPECMKPPCCVHHTHLEMYFRTRQRKWLCLSPSLQPLMSIFYLLYDSQILRVHSHIESSHKYAQVIIQICSDSCGVWWVNKWARSFPEPQFTTACDRMTNFCSALLGPVITLGQNNILPPFNLFNLGPDG